MLAVAVSVLLLLAATAVAAAESSARPAAPSVVGDANESIVLGMGCFWGAEKRMAALPGVVDVEAGYANGDIDGNYEAVVAHESALRRGASTTRNHAEVVKVVFDPAQIDLETVLIHFWENHDPTQGDRQGNDLGSNYRSAIYTRNDAQMAAAQRTRDVYQAALTEAGRGTITTEIAPLRTYFRAEEHHQDYLQKNPDGYCGLGGTGVAYPRHQGASSAGFPTAAALDERPLDRGLQLIVLEAADCASCKRFKVDVLDHRQSDVAVARTLSAEPPRGWVL